MKPAAMPTTKRAKGRIGFVMHGYLKDGSLVFSRSKKFAEKETEDATCRMLIIPLDDIPALVETVAYVVQLSAKHDLSNSETARAVLAAFGARKAGGK